MKVLVGAFNQEKAALVTSRGLLRDCEIFWNLRITFVWSSTILALHTITVTSLCPALCPRRVWTRLSLRRPGEGRGIRVGNFSCPGGGMQQCKCWACSLCQLHNLQHLHILDGYTTLDWSFSLLMQYFPVTHSHNPNLEYLIVISSVKYGRRKVNIYVDCYGI